MDETIRGDRWIYRQPQAFIAVVAAIGLVTLLIILGLRAIVPGLRVTEQKPLEAKIGPEQFKTTGTQLQRDFANGVFKEGDPVDVLLKAHTPDRRIVHPPYETLFFGDPRGPAHEMSRDVRVIAKDGQLIKASSWIKREDQVYHQVPFFSRQGSWSRRGISSDLEFDPDYMESMMNGLKRFTLEEHLRGHVTVAGGPASIGWFVQKPDVLALLDCNGM